MMPETMSDLAGVWVGALLTLCVFSFLFKDNVLFKIMEALFVGVSVGYGIALTWHTGLYPKIYQPAVEFVAKIKTQGLLQWIWAFYMLASVGIGALFIPRLLGERYAWTSRVPMAYSIGLGTGMGIPLAIQTFVLAQMSKTFLPLVVIDNHAVQWGPSAANCAIVLGVLSVLYYFFFSLKKSDPVSRMVSKVGIAYLMLGFGASFAYTIMARITLLIGRAGFLKDDWVTGTLRYFGWM